MRRNIFPLSQAAKHFYIRRWTKGKSPVPVIALHNIWPVLTSRLAQEPGQQTHTSEFDTLGTPPASLPEAPL